LPLHNNNKNAPLLQQNKKGKIQIKENEKNSAAPVFFYVTWVQLHYPSFWKKKKKLNVFYFIFSLTAC
jgi:hypothetical protein